MPTLIVAKDAEQAVQLHKALKTYCASNRKGQKFAKKCGEPEFFNGIPDAEQLQIIRNVIAGSKNMVKVIVTATEHVVGVNFWKICQVMLLTAPKTFA